MANIIRTGWEDKYCMSFQTTSISTAGTFLTTDKGIGGVSPTAKCGLMLIEHPSLMAGLSRDKEDKATGLAQVRYDAANVYEFTDGKKSPTVGLNMGLNAYRLKILGWLLCQKGTVESTNQATCTVPVAGSADCEVWASVGRSFGNPAAALDVGHVIHGCICKQLQITGSAGERVKLSAEMIGRALVSNFDHTSSNFDIETIGELMFFNFTYKFATVDISNYVESVDITITNNAAVRHYGSQTPSHYVLGKFGVSGTMKIAMSAATGTGDNSQLDNYIAGTDILFEATAGTTGTAGYVDILVNMLYSGDPTYDPAEELLIDLPFEGVYDGTNSAFAFTANNGRSDAIPA
jgi:hypothetical protein